MQSSSSAGASSSFPLKLHTLLRDAEEQGFDDIVSWTSNSSFKIHKPKEFSEKIMTKYFTGQTKFKSFQRQLNLYNFGRLQNGAKNLRGSYAHKSFLRDQPNLAMNIVRRKPVASPVLQAKKDTAKHHFKNLEPMPFDLSHVEESAILDSFASSFGFDTPANSRKSEYSGASFFGAGNIDEKELEHEVEIYEDLFLPQECADETMESDPLLENFLEYCMNAPRPSLDRNQSVYAVLQEFASDFVLADATTVVSDNDDSERSSGDSDFIEPKPHVEHSFPWKLHDMLSQAEAEGFANICSWETNGISFRIHDIHQFVEKVLPLYYDQSKFESFRRQLNLYGFTKLSKGPNKGQYSHSNFQRHNRALCEQVHRKVPGSSTKKR